MVNIIEFTQDEPIYNKSEKRRDELDIEVERIKKRNAKQRQKKVKKEDTVQRSYRFLWVKPEYREGLVPSILKEMVAARQKLTKGKIPDLKRKLKEAVASRDELTKKLANTMSNDAANIAAQILALEKDIDSINIELTRLNSKQNSIKVNANGFYGFLSIKYGDLELIEAGMCTTAKGREDREKVSKFVIDNYGAISIYGDTDSIMFIIPEKDSFETNKIALEIQERINGSDRYPAMFPPPIAIEFEKQGRMFAKAKKNYVFGLQGKDGTPKLDDKGRPIVLIKGMAGARRDKPQNTTDITNELSMKNIYERIPIKKTLLYIIDYVEKTLSGEFPDEKFIFVKKVGSDYTSETFCMKVFVDWLNTVGKVIQPEDRLDIVIIETDNPKEKSGKKYRMYEQYIESLSTDEPMKIDYLYYAEHLLMNQVDMLIEAGYSHHLDKLSEIGYVPPRKRNARTLAAPVELLCQCWRDGISFDEVRSLVISEFEDDE
jgi:DNA polymerase elongation subunit (family B)